MDKTEALAALLVARELRRSPVTFEDICNELEACVDSGLLNRETADDVMRSCAPATVTPLLALTVARNMIERPERWTQHANARNRWGGEVDSLSPDAYCWCALAAVRNATELRLGLHSYNLAVKERAFNYLTQASMALGFTSILSANDSVEHAVVLQVFDAAIKSAAANEQYVAPIALPLLL